MWKKLFDPVHANRHGGRLEFIPGIRENEKTRLSFLFCFVWFFLATNDATSAQAIARDPRSVSVKSSLKVQ